MTTISRPRHSILSLFDPLASTDPSTPPRNDSPSADSDKENENPPRNDLTLSTFFNRTYNPVHPLPKPLRRRLIDVGDVTVDDVDPWHSDDEEDSDGLDMNDFDDNENDTLTFRQMAEAATPKLNRPSAFKTPSPLGTRTPLSELTLDHEATPLARDRTLRNPPSIRSKLAEVQFPEIVVCAASPQRRSGRDTDQQEERSAPLREDELGTRTSLDVNPNPLLNSVSSINLPSSSVTGSLISETVIPVIFTPSASIASISDEPCTSGMFDNVRLRPNPPSTSSLDRSRWSVDLQSSFQFHFNDATHFDLLNDKVSFFNSSRNGNASYLDEDSSFDISFGDSTPSELEEIVQTPSATKQTFFEAVCRSPKTGTQANQDSIEQSFSIAEKENTTPSATSPVSSRGGPPSIITRPLETVTPKQPKAGQAVPPAVLALRVVKRSQLAIQKSIAPRTTASPGRLVPRKSLGSLTKSPARSSAIESAEVPPVPSRRSAMTGLLSRPRMTTVEAPKSSLSRATSTAASFASDGPRRVLVSDESEKKSTSRPASRTLGGGSATSLHGGPRRIVPVSERPSIAKGSMSGTGLKHPSAARPIPKPASRTTAGSSLPQPVSRTSRLPAPSVGIRSSGLPARDGTIRATSTIRRV